MAKGNGRKKARGSYAALADHPQPKAKKAAKPKAKKAAKPKAKKAAKPKAKKAPQLKRGGSPKPRTKKATKPEAKKATKPKAKKATKKAAKRGSEINMPLRTHPRHDFNRINEEIEKGTKPEKAFQAEQKAVLKRGGE